MCAMISGVIRRVRRKSQIAAAAHNAKTMTPGP